MKHFLLATFLVIFVKGDDTGLYLTPPDEYKTQQENRFSVSSPSEQVSKRALGFSSDSDFSYPQHSLVGDQFLQNLQQPQNDPNSYGAPLPPRQHNFQQDQYNHQDLEEDSEEEGLHESAEKVSYGNPDKVKITYATPELEGGDYGVPSKPQQLLYKNRPLELLSGFVPSYGPPTKTPPKNLNINVPSVTQSHYESVKPDGGKIFKHVSVHIPPLETESQRAPRVIKTQGTPEKHYNIIFVKAPEALIEDTEVHLPPAPQQKTVVYLLAKNQEVKQSNIRVATPAPTNPTAPEVYFVKYRDNKIELKQQPEQQSYNPPINKLAYLPSPAPSFSSSSFQQDSYGLPSPEPSPFSIPLVSPISSYSNPANSFVSFGPTFSPLTTFSTLAPANHQGTNNPFSSPLQLFPSMTLEQLENSLQHQENQNRQFFREIPHLQNPQQNHREVRHHEQKPRENNRNNIPQLQQNTMRNNIQRNKFNPSQQEFRPVTPVQVVHQQTLKVEQPREYQVVQPPPQKTPESEIQTAQAPSPKSFQIHTLPENTNIEAKEQSSGYSSTSTTTTSVYTNEEQPLPLVFEATRTNKLNHDNGFNLQKRKAGGRRRKAKRGRKRLRKVKKSRRNQQQQQ